MTDDCNHESQTFRGVDTSNEPESVYTEWTCDDCDARISEVYTHEGTRYVQPMQGDPYEETYLNR